MIQFSVAFQNNNYEKPCHSFQLMGGSIEVLDSRILGIDDGVSVNRLSLLVCLYVYVFLLIQL